jgi:hypothetical protein
LRLGPHKELLGSFLPLKIKHGRDMRKEKKTNKRKRERDDFTESIYKHLCTLNLLKDLSMKPSLKIWRM